MTTEALFINIETVPPPMTAAQRAELIGPKSKKTADEAWQSLSTDIWALNVCAVTFASVSTLGKHTPVKTLLADRLANGHPDEPKLLKDAVAAMHDDGIVPQDGPLVVTFNGNGFDLPALTLRAMKYGIEPLFKLLPNKKYDDRSFDVMEKIQGALPFRGKDSYVKMSECLDFFGLDPKAGDGKMVRDWWFNKDLPALEKYTVSNVTQLIELYKIVNQFNSRKVG